jgi:hypothetical protein
VVVLAGDPDVVLSNVEFLAELVDELETTSVYLHTN